MIEPLSEITAKFHVLSLILAYGNEIGVVEEDVGGHEHGVAKKTGIDGGLRPCTLMGELHFTVVGFGGLKTKFFRFVLELGHSLKFPDRGQASQNPCQFGVSDDVGLDELVTFFRIQTAGDILGHTVEYVLAQSCGSSGGRDCVQVNDAKVAFVIFEHGRPIADRAEVIAQGEFPCRLGAGKDDLFSFFFRISHEFV
tara:strand:- start:101 stop:691 length:591 start_codon:yes stop_codon:yes gene_type:complete